MKSTFRNQLLTGLLEEGLQEEVPLGGAHVVERESDELVVGVAADVEEELVVFRLVGPAFGEVLDADCLEGEASQPTILDDLGFVGRDVALGSDCQRVEQELESSADRLRLQVALLVRLAEAEGQLERRDVALPLARDVGEGPLVQLHLAQIQGIEILVVADVVRQLGEGRCEEQLAVRVHEVADLPLALARGQVVAPEDVFGLEEELLEARVQVGCVELESAVVHSLLVDRQLGFDLFVLGGLQLAMLTSTEILS